MDRSPLTKRSWDGIENKQLYSRWILMLALALQMDRHQMSSVETHFIVTRTHARPHARTPARHEF